MSTTATYHPYLISTGSDFVTFASECHNCEDCGQLVHESDAYSVCDPAEVEKFNYKDIETKFRYRAECSCGWHGRWFINPNDAINAGDRHDELTCENKLSFIFRNRHHRSEIVKQNK